MQSNVQCEVQYEVKSKLQLKRAFSTGRDEHFCTSLFLRGN